MSSDNDSTNSGRDTEESKLLKDHEYDGIQEFDFPLPRWWLYTFFITIIFAGNYFLLYQSGGRPSLLEELQSDLKANAELQAKNAPQSISAAEFLSAQGDAQKLEQRLMSGKSVFLEKCMACHGTQAQGAIGPNLIDDYWLNGKGTAEDTARIIQNGVPEKGMPAWASLMQRDEIVNAVLFVKSLKGTKVEGAKAPQGEKIVE